MTSRSFKAVARRGNYAGAPGPVVIAEPEIPEWLPDLPEGSITVYADFVNSRYWNGVVECLVSDLFEDDNNFGWPWSESFIEAGGFASDSSLRGAKIKLLPTSRLNLQDFSQIAVVNWATEEESVFSTIESGFYGGGGAVTPYFGVTFSVDTELSGMYVQFDNEDGNTPAAYTLGIHKFGQSNTSLKSVLALNGVIVDDLSSRVNPLIDTIEWGISNSPLGLYIEQIYWISPALSAEQLQALTL